MSCILDTHTVLWLAGDVPRLSDEAKRVIFDLENEKYVSIASAWEVAIKISIGKLDLDGGVAEFFRMVDENGFTFLPIEKKHVVSLQTLPFRHRDPFDRLLVATAMAEGMPLLTADQNIRLYEVPCIW
jgi:PIN domain nuclease of toxin-antitoxin system